MTNLRHMRGRRLALELQAKPPLSRLTVQVSQQVGSPVVMDGANLAKCEFADAEPVGVSCQSATLTDVLMGHMRSAVADGSSLLRWTVCTGDVRGSRSAGADLTRAVWKDLDARGVNLDRATLDRTVLEHLKLFGVRGRPLLLKDLRCEGVDRSADGNGTEFVSLAQLGEVLKPRSRAWSSPRRGPES
jgi:uncharacterized protein YjbI with pentapeptide repeats